MSYNYYARATFPATARQIEEIAEFLDNDKFFGSVSEGNGLICVSNEMASFGNLEITGLLEKHRVPYDHYHRDDIAVNEWTDKYRINEAGELVDTGYADSACDVSSFAKDVLKALDNGCIEDAYALLNNAVISAEEFMSIEEVAATFIMPGETIHDNMDSKLKLAA